jgi:acetylornithine deacetylase/succinyl-diaminopimelate desuccinylase-like protein
MASWESYLDEHRSEALEELKELLHIPSISSLPEHGGDVQRAARWVAKRLDKAGLKHIEIMPTGGHPVVYADWLGVEDKPTVLIYGHFDVQPVDPIEHWNSSPFEADIRDGLIFARGASDMKGNLLMTMWAVESLLASKGSLPVNVKFFVEGQEEIGSPQLPAFISGYREKLTCDLVLSADGLQFDETHPNILLALKGGCGVQINVSGAHSDLHSGIYGGSVPNPIHSLVRILDSMRSPDGKIVVEGFFDDVIPLTDEDRSEIAAVPFDEKEYAEEIGVPGLFGEPGYSTRERAWARPTLEINGIWGGFQGDGTKTVLPAEAHAKITCRLVPRQDPDRIVELLTAHVKRHAPTSVTVDAQPLAFRAKPYLIPRDHWGNQIASDVLTKIYGMKAYEVRMGASVPVCEMFLTRLGAYTVTFGFSLTDEQVHAPNEFLRLSSYDRGQRAWASLLQEIGARRAVAVSG